LKVSSGVIPESWRLGRSADHASHVDLLHCWKVSSIVSCGAKKRPHNSNNETERRMSLRSSSQETLGLLRSLARELRKQEVQDVWKRTRELMELTRLNRNVNEEQAQIIRRAASDYLVLLQSGRKQQVGGIHCDLSHGK
jgi:hypothetical protein